MRGLLLAPVGGYRYRFRHSLLVHQHTVSRITGKTILDRTERGDGPGPRPSVMMA